MPSGVYTLAQLRLRAQERCDLVGTAFITNSEWLSLLNASYQELYAIIVQAFGTDYYVQTPSTGVTITTNGIDQFFPLASDFFKLLGVDLQVTPSLWVPLKPFAFADRNQFNFYTVPKAGQTVRYFYVPRWVPLVADVDTVDGVNGWEEYIIWDAAIKALSKEESDTSVPMAEKQALVARIQAEAENRDAGSPARVVDVYNSRQSVGMQYRLNGNNLWLIGYGLGAEFPAGWAYRSDDWDY